MTTYATRLPFPVNEGHNFVELVSPNPDHPSHYIAKCGRYFKNYDGRVFVPEEHVEEILADGCKLAPGVSLEVAGVPLTYSYQPPAPDFSV